jgi:quercetin dioxygenase-like cupin family protein
MFYVIEGQLGVKTDREYTTKLSPGDIPFVSEPGLAHEFKTYRLKTIVVEIAYIKEPTFDENDIVRKFLGGNVGAKRRKVEP